MQILKGIDQLKNYLSQSDCSDGCLADTGFLYGASYTDDRVYKQALEVFLILEEQNIPIHTNVVGRMEFVDLVFRKQVTLGAIQVYNGMSSKTAHKNLYDLLKNIRDEDTAARKQGQSYKIGEKRLKKLKERFIESSGDTGWQKFCSKYSGQMLINEWQILEDELGLYFIEVMEGQTSPLVRQPLHWKDMVQTMGELGIRGPDAMIINLFKASSLNLLITADNDFDFFAIDDVFFQNKAVYVLQENTSVLKALAGRT
jgi:hypothetical protein